MRRRGLAMLTIAALVAPWLSTSKRTLAAPTEVVIDYQAHEGCPGRAAFVDAIVARAPDVQVVPAKAGARTLRVRIVAVGKKSRGTVDAIDESGATTNVRSLVGERCEDVAQALSIIVALAIAPNGGTAPTAASSAPSPKASAETDGLAPPAIASATSPESEGWHLAAVLADRLRVGATPRAANGPGVALELAPPGEHLVLRLGMDVGFDPAFGGAAEARFRLAVGHASACLPLGGDALRPRLSGCAGFEAGTLHGEGVSIAHPSAVTTTWLALDLGGAVRLPVGPTFAFAFEGGAALPLLHPRFVFDAPRSVVHETPKITGFFTFSFLVRFL